MFEVNFRVGYVQDALRSMFGPKETLRLRHPFQVFGHKIFAHTEYLDVEVRSCLPNDLMGSIPSTSAILAHQSSRY